MMNQATLIGRLTKEPELKNINGKSVLSFTVAVTRDFKNDQGEYDSDFINCVAWKNTADYIGKYAHKGYLTCVTGRIQVRSYQDQSGKNNTVTEIVVDKCIIVTPKEKEEETEKSDNKLGKNNFADKGDLPF